MRIAVVCEVYLPKIDGVVRRTMHLVEELRRAGDEVLVICPRVPAERSSPVPMVEFESFPCPCYPEYHIGRADRSLVAKLTQFQPDIVHYLNPFAFGFQCADILGRAMPQLPTLFSFHTLYGEFVRRYAGLRPLSALLWWLTKQYHNVADCNLTVSASMVDDLKQRGFERVSLWPPAVDSVAFSPSKASTEMRCRLSGNHPESPLILSVSRLAPEKNVGLLADIMDRVPNARLAIVGDGPDREKLERQFSRLPVTFPGYMSGAELASAYASSDVFLYASETETMGNVILEAMASGLPVVAAAAGGVRSLISPGRTGFLFPPGCAKDAAALVRQLVNDTELREKLAENSLNEARKQTWSDAASVVRTYYEQTIRKQPATQRSRAVTLTASACTRLLIQAFSIASKFKRNGTRPEAKRASSSVSSSAGELVQLPGT